MKINPKILLIRDLSMIIIKLLQNYFQTKSYINHSNLAVDYFQVNYCTKKTKKL